MGVYYKLVNLTTHERIEPSQIGGGGIKGGAMVAGVAANLFMYLHVYTFEGTWEVVSDSGDEGPYFDNSLVDATEKYRLKYNSQWSGMDEEDKIPRSRWA